MNRILHLQPEARAYYFIPKDAMQSSLLLSFAGYLLFLLSPLVEAVSSASDPSAIALIRNNINLYSILQDTKNYQALDQVFTPDASPYGLAPPNPKYPNNLTGIELLLQDALGDAITLHYSDTQYIELGPKGDTATAVSYAQAVYFAKDVNVTQQTATFYESFTDDFVLLGGRWLSRQKNITVTVCCLSLPLSTGKTTIMPGSTTGERLTMSLGCCWEPICHPGPIEGRQLIKNPNNARESWNLPYRVNLSLYIVSFLYICNFSCYPGKRDVL